jgi:hypothetical protein
MTTADIVVVLVCIFWLGVLIFVIMNPRGGEKVATPVLAVYEKRRKTMADLLKYAVSAPAPVDGDVVGRELTVVVDGTVQSVVKYSGQTVAFDDVEVPQDSAVTLRLVDVDDAGNRSEPAELAFVAVDTLPPAVPGALGVTLVGERRPAPVVEEPAVEVVDEVEEPAVEVVDEAAEDEAVDEAAEDEAEETTEE